MWQFYILRDNINLYCLFCNETGVGSYSYTVLIGRTSAVAIAVVLSVEYC